MQVKHIENKMTEGAWDNLIYLVNFWMNQPIGVMVQWSFEPWRPKGQGEPKSYGAKFSRMAHKLSRTLRKQRIHINKGEMFSLFIQLELSHTC